MGHGQRALLTSAAKHDDRREPSFSRFDHKPDKSDHVPSNDEGEKAEREPRSSSEQAKRRGPVNRAKKPKPLKPGLY